MSEGIAAVNSDQVAGQRQVKPEWSDRRSTARWAATQAQAARDDGGGRRARPTTYPPAAYAWQAIGYKAAPGGSAVRPAARRAADVGALAAGHRCSRTWLLAGELFGRRRLLQTAAASVPALAPMVVFISGSVSPDGMLYAVWTFALWLGARAIRRGVPVEDGAAFFALRRARPAPSRRRASRCCRRRCS